MLQSQSGVNISRNDIEGLALSGVIQWMKVSVVSCIGDDKIPVYNQKDVVDIDQEQLRNHGANENFILSVHCTHLIEKMLLSVLGIIATQTGQSTSSRVVLTLDVELGKALFQACIHSTVDDVLVIADAARRTRKVLFCDNKTFDDDISLECQESNGLRSPWRSG